MRRSAVSISSNIAEGSSKKTGKEKARYTTMAFGSLMELLSQIEICKELQYVTENESIALRDLVDEIAVKSTRLREAQLKMA